MTESILLALIQPEGQEIGVDTSPTPQSGLISDLSQNLERTFRLMLDAKQTALSLEDTCCPCILFEIHATK